MTYLLATMYASQTTDDNDKEMTHYTQGSTKRLTKNATVGYKPEHSGAAKPAGYS